MPLIRIAALTVLLGFAGLVYSQTAGINPTTPAKKSALEEALEEALKTNPDLRVAAAKLAEAEAEVSRVRLQVARKVVAACSAIEEAKTLVRSAKEKLARIQKLGRAISQEEIARSEAEMLSAQEKAAAAEADLAYLLGKTSAKDKSTADARRLYSSSILMASDSWLNRALVVTDRPADKASLKTPAAARIRTALEKKANFSFKDTTAHEILAAIRKEASGLHIQTGSTTVVPWGNKGTATLEGVTVAAALQYLEDVMEGEQRVYVREYGLLIAPSTKVPPGAVTLADFLARPAVSTTGVQDPTSGSKTGPLLEGAIAKVESNLVTLSVGSNKGVTAGQTFEVYRLGPSPKYLGKVRVIETTPEQSVAQIVGKATDTIKVGDSISTRIEKSSGN